MKVIEVLTSETRERREALREHTKTFRLYWTGDDPLHVPPREFQRAYNRGLLPNSLKGATTIRFVTTIIPHQLRRELQVEALHGQVWVPLDNIHESILAILWLLGETEC